MTYVHYRFVKSSSPASLDIYTTKNLWILSIPTLLILCFSYHKTPRNLKWLTAYSLLKFRNDVLFTTDLAQWPVNALSATRLICNSNCHHYIQLFTFVCCLKIPTSIHSNTCTEWGPNSEANSCSSDRETLHFMGLSLVCIVVVVLCVWCYLTCICCACVQCCFFFLL